MSTPTPMHLFSLPIGTALLDVFSEFQELYSLRIRLLRLHPDLPAGVIMAGLRERCCYARIQCLQWFLLRYSHSDCMPVTMFCAYNTSRFYSMKSCDSTVADIRQTVNYHHVILFPSVIKHELLTHVAKTLPDSLLAPASISSIRVITTRSASR